MVDVTDERIDPAAVIAAILRDVVDSGCSRSRHLIRMMPLQATCFASLEDLEVTAKPLIEKHFGSAADGDETAKRKVCAGLACPCALLSPCRSDDRFCRDCRCPRGLQEYAVVIKRRNNLAFPKDEAIDLLARLVGKGHRVNLKRPDTVIIVEIFKAICGVSVVDDFHSLCQFNLRQAVETKPTANGAPPELGSDDAAGQHVPDLGAAGEHAPDRGSDGAGAAD